MEIDVHLSPFSWQLLHSCLTPALWSRVAVSQTPWQPRAWQETDIVLRKEMEPRWWIVKMLCSRPDVYKTLFSIFLSAININNDRIMLATLTFLPQAFLIKGSTYLPLSSEVEVHCWQLSSTILIQTYLLSTFLQAETFSNSAAAFETPHSAKLSSEPFK